MIPPTLSGAGMPVDYLDPFGLPWVAAQSENAPSGVLRVMAGLSPEQPLKRRFVAPL